MVSEFARNSYPYVVIRWMAAAYGRREVIFVASGHSVESSQEVLVADSAPWAEGALTSRARAALIERVLELVRESGYRMCVVFAKDDSVYCERDGSTWSQSEAPSGGIRLDEVTRTGAGTQ